MLTHSVFGRGEFLAYGQEFHGPLIALGVALALAVAGRLLKAGLLAAASGGAGVVAGWYVLSSMPFTWAPRLLPDRLSPLAVGALVLALTAARFALSRGPWPPLLLTTLGCGWWLSGGPLTHAALLADWPVAAAVALAIFALGWLCTGPVADPLRPALAAFTLAAALHVVGASWSWTVMALVPACASLAMLAAPRMPALVLLPLAADTAAVGSATDLAVGRLARGEIRAVDVAVLSPLLALWLAPMLVGRLRLAGRAGPVLSAVLAGAIAVGVAWGTLRLRGR
jgi:hypothetical protein